MIKRFPSSRNHRSKGIKVKHVLQVILLLGVSFWLIYQVKHNHDKKKEFDKDDAKLSVKTQTDQIVKLGRKDLHQGKDEVNQKEKHEEVEEDEHIVEDEENKHEHVEQEEDANKHETEESEDMHEGREQEEHENKHVAEEQEEEENKSEDIEDEEGGGGGTGDIEENDQEKSEVDIDHDDEIIDEEKEKEEGGDEKEKEDEEKGGLVENHNDHEAREEHYKGDDASSAVAHDAHATSTETETTNLENSGVNLEMNITKPENEITYSDESNTNQNDSDLKVREGEVTDGVSSNATAGTEMGNDGLSNATAKINTDRHLEISGNLTVATTEASSNLTEAGADILPSSEQNKTVILSEPDHAQNTTVNTTNTGDIKNVQTEGLEQSGNRISEENLPSNYSSVSVKTENEDAAAGETTIPGAGELEKTIRYVSSNETESTFRNLDRNVGSDTPESDKTNGSTETSKTNETQNVDATEDEMFKADTQTGETDEKSDSSSDSETLDSVEHDAIDSSDTHIHEDVAKVRTDLGTLPDIRNEGDENAAE